MIDAICELTTTRMRGHVTEDDRVVHARIRAEYREMPGLCLTLSQAARLFDLDLVQCARVLDTLVKEGALWTNGREFHGPRRQEVRLSP